MTFVVDFTMESPTSSSAMEVDSPRSDTESGTASEAAPTSPSQPPQDATVPEAPPVEVVDTKKLENEHAKAMLQRPDAIFEPDCFQHLRKYISTGGSPVEVIQMLEQGYVGYPQMCNLVCSWLKTAGVRDEEIEEIVYQYVKKSILEKFDVAKTDILFQHLQAVPEWLEAMLNAPKWRKVLYELSAKHKDSLLLNYAIQRISEAGFQDEIASLPAANTYFPVYNRVLDYAFGRVVKMSEDDLFNFLPEFTKMCNHGEHTYLYAQALSYMLAGEPGGDIFRRLSQELERDVADKGTIAQKLAFYLTNILEYPSLMASISTILGEGRANVADMDKIYNLYTSPAPPPVKYIRRPDLIDILIHDLFETSSSSLINKEDARKWTWVAAYASAVVDNRPILAYADTAKVEAPLEPPRVDKKALETIAAHITSVREICRRSYFGPELISAVDQLRAHIDTPLASLGIIRWVRANLVEGNNFATAFNTKSSNSYFALLREICHIHPFQRPKVFEVLTACFEVETDLDALMALSAKKVVVDQLAFLMEIGYVPPVLKYAVGWSSRHVDQSVTRHFITKVLENSEEPYSVQFIEAMASLLAPLTVEALKASDTAKVVMPFLMHSAYSGYSLSKETAKQIQQLMSATGAKKS